MYQNPISAPPSHSPYAYTHRPPALPAQGDDYHVGPEGSPFDAITEAITKEAQAPDLLSIQAALGAMSLVLQDQVRVERPNDGASLPVSLIIIGVARSGERKSTVMNAYMEPIHAYWARERERTQKAKAQYDSRLTVWNKTRSKLMNDVSKADAARLRAKARKDSADLGAAALAYQQANDALQLHMEDKPTAPLPINIGILSDVTPQAISKFIKENHVRSLGIMTAEGEEFLSNGIKQQSSILNKGYSGEATNRYRAGEGEQSYDIPITTCIFVQPEVAHNAFSGPKNLMRATGTLARTLFAYPASTQGTRFLNKDEISVEKFVANLLQDNESYQDTQKIKEKYCQWITKRLAHSSSASTEKMSLLTLKKEAQALWYQAFNECEMHMQPGNRYEAFTDHASKLPDQWLRVAAIIHSYNHATSGEISTETLVAAIRLVNAFSDEFVRTFRSISNEEKDIFTLQGYIDRLRQRYRYLPKRYITSCGPLRPTARCNAALFTLSQQGHITLSECPTRNSQGRQARPITMIDLAPHLPPDRHAWENALNHARSLNQR